MFARLAQIAAAWMALFLCGPAHATPLAYGTYYDENLQAACSGQNCRIDFSQIPANKLLMVSKITCMVASAGPVFAGILQVSATFGGAPLPRSLILSPPPSQYNNNASLYYTNLQQDTRYLIGQGRFPAIILYTSVPSGNIVCTLIGELVNPIQ
jgi:hypothetical protein